MGAEDRMFKAQTDQPTMSTQQQMGTFSRTRLRDGLRFIPLHSKCNNTNSPDDHKATEHFSCHITDFSIILKN